MNCTALALSEDGKLRLYSKLNFGSQISDSNWLTMINIRKSHKTKVPEQFENITFCCDLKVRLSFDIESAIDFVLFRKKWETMM